MTDPTVTIVDLEFRTGVAADFATAVDRLPFRLKVSAGAFGAPATDIPAPVGSGYDVMRRRAANDLTVHLRTVLGEDRFPVDVEALAREVSRNHEDPIATIRGVDIPGFEGMLRVRKRKPGWHILYSTQPRYRGRERFTLAHEFGHYMLHRRRLTAGDYRNGELAENLDFRCLPLQADRWNPAEKQREEEADTFASYLLMPIDDYRNQVDGHDMTRSAVVAFSTGAQRRTTTAT